MWIFLTSGFFSVVAHRERKEDVLIRARSAYDLRNLIVAAKKLAPTMPAIDLVQSPRADYPFRAVFPRATLALLLAQNVDALDYDNFKNRVAEVQGHERARLYHDVWDTMHGIDPRYANRLAPHIPEIIPITIVVKEPGKKAEIQAIAPTLEAMQKIVEGNIDLLSLDFLEGLDLYLNEEGKIQRLKPNFSIPGDVIVGTVFVSKADVHGDPESLTDEEATRAKKILDGLR